MSNYQDEYEDPERYDAEYGSYLPDGPLFESLLTSDIRTVLDLACGTGRLTIPLAKKGLQVVGLDISSPMLYLAQQKSKDLSIRWVLGDCRNSSLCQLFDLIIMGGNAFQALLTKHDQYLLFRNIKAHLAPHGLFAFNLRTSIAVNHESKTLAYWHSFPDQQGSLVDVYGCCSFDEEANIGTYTTERRGMKQVTQSQISLKFTSLEELKSMLKESGLEIIEAWGSAEREPLTSESESMYLICCFSMNN